MMRGINRQVIFQSDADRRHFITILGECKEISGFKLHAFCLMPNHIHLLIEPAGEPLDMIFRRIGVRYAMWYNRKYQRVGHLFQDRYKSIPVENDAYLLSVVRYIHNNPVKAGICPADQYRWSSWKAYTGSASLVRTDLVLGLAGGLDGFRAFSLLDDADGVEHLEVMDRRRVSDTKAQMIIRDKLHLESGTRIQDLDRAGRDAALKKLKAEGLSVRQIERLTGINRGVIQNA